MKFNLDAARPCNHWTVHAHHHLDGTVIYERLPPTILHTLPEGVHRFYIQLQVIMNDAKGQQFPIGADVPLDGTDIFEALEGLKASMDKYAHAAVSKARDEYMDRCKAHALRQGFQN